MQGGHHPNHSQVRNDKAIVRGNEAGNGKSEKSGFGELTLEKIGHKPTRQIIADKCFLNEPEINSCPIFKSGNRRVKRTPEEEADFQDFIKDKDSTWGTNMDHLFTRDEDEDKVFELHKQDSSTPTNEPVSKVIPAERLNEPKKVISGKKTNKATVGATAKQ